ncbi:putative nucleolar protein 4-like isoform X1 [Penaeus vannamei]|uniref:Putative nucleolar protein 4-like isoform X1 n=1 Tax=Penaeus vannamei TaxID=6689 RepID=A0A423TA65_PENVA|nr:putative nucleolar protein 4-like isoform X1 [Penaeus vannamei]
MAPQGSLSQSQRVRGFDGKGPPPAADPPQQAVDLTALFPVFSAEVERKVETRASSEWTPYQHQPLGLSRSDVPRRSPCPSPSGSERAATATPLDTASNAEDTSSNGNKDDEDDDADDDNDDDKIDAQYDPERLKAFNMFVRLFVDENLDRIVPISKQPKEKIQAIIDACARQFPEFAERTRKRIRTYLKSCRRNKRTRDSNGWETPSRPTPPHLTSIQAEQILANACENEAQNAKRMRLGLEPIAQPNPLNPLPQAPMGQDKPMALVDTVVKTESSAPPHVSALAKALERPLADAKVMNGSSMFQASFQQSFQKVTSLTGSTVHTQPGLTPLIATTSSPMLANGPTDLSVKGTSKPTRPTLNAVEVAAVRQLITGYRESAAFLLRSADELENLLIHQQSP